MNRPHYHKPTWMLVADGSRARLFQMSPSEGFIEIDSWDSEEARKMPHELQSERAGQAMPGHSFDNDDPQAKAQLDFTRLVCEEMKERVDDFDSLILVAAPKTLGILRKQLDPSVSSKIQQEIDRDWTHVRVHDMAQMLDKARSAH